MIYDLQKANFFKRISAFLLDLILIAILFTAGMLIISGLVDYDSNLTGLEERLTAIQDKHNITAIEEQYKVSFNEYQYMLPEEVEVLPENVKLAFDACKEEMNTDSVSIKLYETIMTLSILIVSISMLIAFVVLEFIVPLFFKNGQTLGKKVFSIAVMRVDAVRITPMILFVRSILGKYTIGTMVPLIMLLTLFFGATPLMPIVILLGILLLQIVLYIFTKTNSLIHDMLASTVVVDFQSQMIFDSVQAKNEYQLRIHDEAVNKSNY